MKKIVLLLLILVACTTQGTTYVGTEGLQVKIVGKAEANANSRFDAMLSFENVGASDTVASYFISYDKSRLKISKPSGELKLSGRSSNRALGDKAVVVINAEVYSLEKQLSDTVTKMSINTCYEYRTEATANLCLDTDLYGTRKKVCAMGPVSTSGGQGGPVGMTFVEPEAISDEEGTSFKFYVTVANVGKGVLLPREEYMNYCRGEPFSVQRPLVNGFLSDEALSCSWDSDTKITCASGPLPKELGAYSAQLTLSMEYGYGQTLVYPLKIRQNEQKI